MESEIREYLQSLADSTYSTKQSRVMLFDKRFDNGDGNNQETAVTLELWLIFNESTASADKTTFIDTETLENAITEAVDITISSQEVTQKLTGVKESVNNGLFTRILKIQYLYHI